jgi:hypothetical protein
VGNMIRRVLHLIRDVAGEQGAGHPAAIVSEVVNEQELQRPASAFTLLQPERPRGQLASFYANVLEVSADGGTPQAQGRGDARSGLSPPQDADAVDLPGSEGGGNESALSLEGMKSRRKGRQWSGHRTVRAAALRSFVSRSGGDWDPRPGVPSFKSRSAFLSHACLCHLHHDTQSVAGSHISCISNREVVDDQCMAISAFCEL